MEMIELWLGWMERVTEEGKRLVSEMKWLRLRFKREEK
jgi:hypothetical protein